MREILKAINEMEKACLSDGSLTTLAMLEKSSFKEIKGYYYWLCKQTPSWYHRDFDQFLSK